MSTLPEKIEKHLCAICHWPDGTAVIGSSCLAGKYWTGSVWCYKDASDVPDISKCVTGVEMDSGVCDMVPVGQDKVLIALDSGAVEMLIREKDPDVLKSEFYGNEHDDTVGSVDVSHDLSKGVSGGYDYGIKVWCLESYTSIHTYRPAHSNLVRCVAFSKKDSEIFLSCGLDRRIIVWDIRSSQPASLLGGTTKENVPTALAWQPGGDTVAVGCDTGEIALFDVRQAGRTAGKWRAHDRSVHKLRFSPSNSNLLASCADEKQVVVSDVGHEAPKVTYRKDCHESFVRDVSWHPLSDALISCGWDTRVFVHSLAPET